MKLQYVAINDESKPTLKNMIVDYDLKEILYTNVKCIMETLYLTFEEYIELDNKLRKQEGFKIKK